MSTTGVAIVIAVLLVCALVAVWMVGSRRRARLRDQFGPEYARTVHEMGSRKRAEAELTARRDRVQRFPLRPLTEMERAHFSNRWHDAQAAFVDDPRAAIGRADTLLGELMQTVGYPMSDFEQRAADLSVEHPAVVRNYRTAHEVALRSSRGEATTEDLRNAMILYRDLFAELLDTHAADHRAAS